METECLCFVFFFLSLVFILWKEGGEDKNEETNGIYMGDVDGSDYKHEYFIINEILVLFCDTSNCYRLVFCSLSL